MIRNLMMSLGLSAGLVLAASSSVFAGEGWTEDFAAAQAQAEKENKDLLLDFTGSDWCGWCKRLDAEVFSKEEFKAYAAKNLVLVTLDFPRSRQMPDATKKQNADLQAKFAVRGYPTIILMDSKGNAYGRTGYKDGGPEVYIKHLQGLKEGYAKRVAALAKAEKLTGVDRAKALDEAVNAQTEGGVESNDKLIDEIIKLDAENKAGLKAKYEAGKALVALEQTINTTLRSKDFEGASKAIETFAETYKPTGETAQKIGFYRAVVLLQQNKLAEAMPILEEAVKIAPDSQVGQHITKNVIPAVKRQMGNK